MSDSKSSLLAEITRLEEKSKNCDSYEELSEVLQKTLDVLSEATDSFKNSKIDKETFNEIADFSEMIKNNLQ